MGDVAWHLVYDSGVVYEVYPENDYDLGPYVGVPIINSIPVWIVWMSTVLRIVIYVKSQYSGPGRGSTWFGFARNVTVAHTSARVSIIMAWCV